MFVPVYVARGKRAVRNGNQKMVQAPTLPTVGKIAQRFGVPVHRVVYVVESRGIAPAGIAGNVRVFDEPSVSRIASELARIKRDRGGQL